MRLKDKVAIVTGAASGMGAADARMFAREGAKVVIADILEEDASAIVQEIADAGGVAVFEKLDVTDPADWERVTAAAVSRFGKLDILVNNAGLTGAGVDDVTEIDRYDRIMAVNLRGVFLGIRAAVPHMAASGGGSIVNMSSICGNTGTPGIHLAYNASKGGVRALTKAAAAQYGPDKVRVNSIHPGVLPPMRNRVQHTDVGERTLARVPLGRTGEVDEVASTALFLASDDSSYVSGAEIYVDGGYLAA